MNDMNDKIALTILGIFHLLIIFMIVGILYIKLSFVMTGINLLTACKYDTIFIDRLLCSSVVEDKQKRQEK